MKFTNKQDRNLFLEKNIKKNSYGSFALVTYEGKTHSIYFSRYNMEDGPYFLEAPNQLFGIEIPDNVDVNDWVEEYINNVYEMDYLEELKANNEYEDFKDEIKTFIVDGKFYEIDSPQTGPFLPDVLDDLTLISEEYCLWYLLNVENKEIGEMEIL